MMHFTNSNRGIDILCRALAEEGHNVTHLVFPIYNKKMVKKTLASTNRLIQQIYANKVLIPYDDDTMFWFPRTVMKLIHYSHLRSIKYIDFSSYDLIVLESGKPLFLIDVIPKNVSLIYRQSDPVWALMKSRYLRELEEKVMKRANLVLIVRTQFLNSMDFDFRDKVFVWKNGFNVLLSNEIEENPYRQNSLKKAVYLGLAPIDYRTLDYVSSFHLDVEFHIIGNTCLSYFESRKLRKKKNIFVHGYMSPEKYLPYVKNADFAIVPYKKTKVKFFGLTSKYLLFMYFNLPIVSYYKPLDIEEFGNLPVLFASNIDEFSKQIDVAKKMGKINYDIDFSYYSYKGRKKELLEILEKAAIIKGF